MRRIVLILCGVAWGVLACANAQAKDYKCPESLDIAPGKVSAVPDFEEWHDPQVKHYITGIDLYDGPPKDMAQLKPDNGDEVGDTNGALWTFADGSKGVWMVCSYSDTDARIIREIDAHEKSCAEKRTSMPDGDSAVDGVSLECR